MAAHTAAGNAGLPMNQRYGRSRTCSADRSYYGAIERGEFNLTVDTILKITTGLGTTAAELFQRAGL